MLLTKADKLTRAEAQKALSIMRLNAGGGEVRLFSALKRTGVEDVAHILWQWAHPAQAAQPIAAETSDELSAEPVNAASDAPDTPDAGEGASPA